jgi:Protein of unknown function (DUF3455)
MRFSQRDTGTCKIQRKVSLAVVLAVPLMIAVSVLPFHHAAAQVAPSTATSLAPPSGNVAFLKAYGTGTQNYICLPGPSGTAWAFQRPQATLTITAVGPFRLQVGQAIFPVLSSGAFQLEVAEHFQSAVPSQTAAESPACVEAADSQHQYCPTWQSPHDQSEVWGTVVASVPAGSGEACPNSGAIACLLLKASGTSTGQFADGLFSRTTYIQRTNTTGGAAPTTACVTDQLEFVPYTADYTFYNPESAQ